MNGGSGVPAAVPPCPDPAVRVRFCPAQPGSPAGLGEFGPGKAAAEIYDAGGQSVKAVYHHQVGLKERKHIFNKKRGFAIQLRC